MNGSAHRPAPRLAQEASAYLRQHAHQPVDWYPWGDEAFETARREDRPVLLSVGYAACHWCHVMSHEYFENADVAELINRWYVPVKVDREQRPDVDELYMRYVVLLTGTGGWPLTVWLTPDRAPFFGGTYFPPEPRGGLPGFADLLRALAELWRHDRARVLSAAEESLHALRGSAPAAPRVISSPDRFEAAAVQAQRHWLGMADLRYGGFGDAPKFPNVPLLAFLLHRHARSGDTAPLRVALHALQAMATGGLRDHLGGGFHRYAVDAQWRVPHFEKMLPDQAQLAEVYLEAHRLTGSPQWAAVAHETAAFICRELAARDGRLWAALDADSPSLDDPQRLEEGAYYTWTVEELRRALSPELSEFAAAAWGIGDDGSGAGMALHGLPDGRRVLRAAMSAEQLARHFGIDPAEAMRRLKAAQTALREQRSRRPRPAADDLAVAGWSGLAISALARVGRVFEDPELIATARRAASWLMSHLWDPTVRCLHRCERGNGWVPAFAEDYAAVIRALLDLYEADYDPEWLRAAREIQAAMDQRLWDPATSQYRRADLADGPPVMPEETDELTLPSSAALTVHNLMRFWLLLETPADRDRLDALLGAAAAKVICAPELYPALLDAATARPHALRVVVYGCAGDPRAEELCRTARRTAPPWAVVIRCAANRETDLTTAIQNLIATAAPPRNAPTALVCTADHCRPPITDPDQLALVLSKPLS